MKKLITLLLVLTGMVTTASAWGDLYLICEANNNWSNTSYSDEFKFTCLAENQYRATVPGSYINSGDWYFRFRDTGDNTTWQNISPESTENNQEITQTPYSTNWQNSSAKAFYVSKNAEAKYVHIYCNWNTSSNKWEVSCSIVTTTTNYHVAFTNPSKWEDVYVYAYLDGVKLSGAWPGTKVNLSDGDYKYTIIGAPNSKVIFNKVSGGDGNQSWTMDVVDNGVYNYSSIVENQTVSVSSFKNGTFSSEYPLDFSNVEGLKAYRIYDVQNGVLSTEEVGKVPANTGLYIEGTTASGNYTVPTTATATAIGDNYMKPGTGATVSQTDGTNTNFVLTTNKGASATPKFYKVNGTDGNVVAAGKAYLQVPTASVGARDFFWFNEDVTAIDALKQATSTNGEYFNLAGQRVAQPTKGLYIVNGKKVVIK